MTGRFHVVGSGNGTWTTFLVFGVGGFMVVASQVLLMRSCRGAVEKLAEGWSEIALIQKNSGAMTACRMVLFGGATPFCSRRSA